MWSNVTSEASIAQLGERKTEDLEALCSIHSRGNYLFVYRVLLHVTRHYEWMDSFVILFFFGHSYWLIGKLAVDIMVDDGMLHTCWYITAS